MDMNDLNSPNIRIEVPIDSAQNTLRTLPQYLGEYEAYIEIIPVPTLKGGSEVGVEEMNVQAILSSLITLTLPLGKALRMHPWLWKEIAN